MSDIPPRERSERLINIAIVITMACAVSLTSLAALRFFRDQNPVQQTVTVVKDWRRYAREGHRMGSADAKVTIVEFSDFQCPFCARLEPTLKELRRRYGPDMAVVYRHFPLDNIHEFARPAALAAECAANTGQFEALHDALFENQDSLKTRPMTWFAERAALRDTATFKACMNEERGEIALRQDVAAGTALGVEGTPTILVNQYRLLTAPSPHTLDSLVRLVLRGH